MTGKDGRKGGRVKKNSVGVKKKNDRKGRMEERVAEGWQSKKKGGECTASAMPRQLLFLASFQHRVQIDASSLLRCQSAHQP